MRMCGWSTNFSIGWFETNEEPCNCHQWLLTVNTCIHCDDVSNSSVIMFAKCFVIMLWHRKINSLTKNILSHHCDSMHDVIGIVVCLFGWHFLSIIQGLKKFDLKKIRFLL